MAPRDSHITDSRKHMGVHALPAFSNATVFCSGILTDCGVAEHFNVYPLKSL